MKIICTKNEFAQLVRSCAWSLEHEDCNGCMFMLMCSGDGTREDTIYEISGIEDICEVIVDR